MTADIELLPLPEPLFETESRRDLFNVPQVQAYARANVAHYIRQRDAVDPLAVLARAQKAEAEVEELRAEVEKLRELCGCAYQMAGYHDAPVEWLDALGDAGGGTPLSEWRVQSEDLSDVLLPYQPDTAPTSAEARAERLAEALREKADKWDRIGDEHGVRQFTGNDHRLFANELRALLRDQEVGNG